MARTIPTTTYHVPGDLVTAETWNTGPKALNDFLTNRPVFQGQCHSASTVASNSWTAVPFDFSLIDTDGGNNVAFNNTRYTIQVAGQYWVVGMVAWNTAGSGLVRADSAVAKNGSIYVGSSQFLSIQLASPSSMTCSALVQGAVGDYIEMWGRQLSGANQLFDTGTLTNGSTRTGYGMMNLFWVRS